MTIKERLKQVRDIFSTAIAPVAAAIAAPPVAAPTAAPPATTGTEYTLADGVTKVTISNLATGGIITPTPPTEGSITLSDGTVVAYDATGVILSITAPAEQVGIEDMNTPEQMRAFLTRFADDNTPTNTSGMGGTDVQKLAIVVKALFEDRFGWELRRAKEEAERAQAIEIYKTGFSANQTALTSLMDIVEKLSEMEVGEPTETEEKAWDDMTPLERFRATKQSSE